MKKRKYLKEVQQLQKIAGIIKEENWNFSLENTPEQEEERERILDILQDNYGISDAVQEFLGWDEEEAENADGTNWDDVVDTVMEDPELKARILNGIDEDYKWTSTRTDQYPTSTQNRPKEPVTKVSGNDSSLWDDDIVKNRFERMKSRVYYDAKSKFLEYDKMKGYYTKPGEKYDLQAFKKILLHSIESNITQYFFDQLKKKYNITFSKQYFQEVPSLVDKITSKLPNDPSSEQVSRLWPEFKSMLHQMFKSNENLGR